MNGSGSPTGQWRGLPWFEEKPQKPPAEDCPHCGRPVTIYPRKLSSAMSRNLVRMYWLRGKYPDKPYFHVKEFDKEGARGEFGVLSFWGLVEGAHNQDSRKRTSGMWTLTAFGMAFVRREAELPQYVLVGLRSSLQGYAGPMVDIKVCLEFRNRFRYDELMGADYGKGVQLLLDMSMGPKNL